MISYLLPVALILVPVAAMILLTAGRGKELKGSCGGVGNDGKCSRCGKPAAEMPGALGVAGLPGSRNRADAEPCP